MNNWWEKVGAEDYDYHDDIVDLPDDEIPTDDKMDGEIEDDTDMSIDVDFDKDGDEDRVDVTIVSGTTGTPPLFLVVISTILVAVYNCLS
jgi:hypothetical protein